MRTERSTKKTDPFYRSARWQAFRRLIIQRNGHICADCGATKRDGNLHVDHVVPIKDDPRRAFDFGNVVCRCHSCHSRKTATADGGFGNKRKAWNDKRGCDEHGNPLDDRAHW